MKSSLHLLRTLVEIATEIAAIQIAGTSIASR